MPVKWAVEMTDEFELEFDALHEDVQTEILALSVVLEQFGPQLGRPRVDTLNNSRHANIKELPSAQQMVNGEWPSPLIPGVRRFYLLQEQSGGSEKRFYRELIRKADERFDAHLARLGNSHVCEHSRQDGKVECRAAKEGRGPCG